MKRPLCIVSIMFLLGILIGLYFQKSIAFLCILSIFFALGCWFYYKKKLIFLFVLSMIFGIVYSTFLQMQYQKKYQLFKQKDSICFHAVIVSDVVEKDYQYVYTIQVDDTYLLLYVKKKETASFFKYGDQIELKCKVEVPNTARNYHGFDYQNYLKTKKISGIVRISEEQVKIVQEGKINFFNQAVHFVKTHIQTKLYDSLPKETASLCLGFLVGQRDQIPEDITSFFRESNLTHLLAISGTHISYLILGVSFLCVRIGKKFSKVITVCFLLFFMALTDFTPSVTRASITAILMLTANLFHRKSDVYQNMGIASIIILLQNPYAVLDIGFQLSFGGTLGIVLWQDRLSKLFDLGSDLCQSSSKFRKIKEYVVVTLLTTISANFMILPIMAYHFKTLSITFWISNLLVSPLVGLVIFGGFIFYFISTVFKPFVFLIQMPYHFLLVLFIKIAEYCSHLPGSVIYVKTPSLFFICMYYCLLFFLFHIKKEFCQKIKELFILLICIIFLFSYIFTKLPKDLRIYFIDVGQGDSTLICTPKNTTILIDGGGSDNGFDVGEKVLLPYLLDRGICKLDYIMISHFDSDHVVGLFTIMEKLRVKNIILSRQGKSSSNYLQFQEIVKRKKINIIFVKAGDRVLLDKECYFDILFPKTELISENVLNNNSIVAKFCYFQFSMLLTGDIEEMAEKRLTEEYERTNQLQATLLKVGHHGSKSSSTQAFLNLIKPKIALIGVGEKNKFGHPNANVLERLRNLRK